ncbi:unnamed protein product [Caenorhabditis brenneri]
MKFFQMLSSKSFFALLVVIGMDTALPTGGDSGSGLPVPTEAELTEFLQRVNDIAFDRLYRYNVVDCLPPIPSDFTFSPIEEVTIPSG